MRAVVHRQPQGIHARATVIIRIRMGVGAGCRIGRTMPLVAFASYLRLHIVRTAVDGQLQRIHARATVGIRVRMGVGAGCRIGRAVPGKALASSLRLHIVRTVVDGQLQSVNTCATVCIRVRIGVFAALSVGRTVPRKALAGRLRLHIVRAVIDCQLQRVHARTSIRIVVRIGVGAGSSVGRTVPLVALAGYLRLYIVRAMVDGQLQRIHARTARSIGVRMGIGAGSRIGRTVPRKALAGRLRLHIVRTVVDGQLQRVHARTTVRTHVLVGIIAANRISIPMPRETLASHRCSVFRSGKTYRHINKIRVRTARNRISENNRVTTRFVFISIPDGRVLQTGGEAVGTCPGEVHILILRTGYKLYAFALTRGVGTGRHVHRAALRYEGCPTGAGTIELVFHIHSVTTITETGEHVGCLEIKTVYGIGIVRSNRTRDRDGTVGGIAAGVIDWQKLRILRYRAHHHIDGLLTFHLAEAFRKVHINSHRIGG